MTGFVDRKLATERFPRDSGRDCGQTKLRYFFRRVELSTATLAS
jgi:hypothetical protein